MKSTNTRVVGRSVQKIDAVGLALGAHAFTDDFLMRDMLYEQMAQNESFAKELADIKEV